MNPKVSIIVPIHNAGNYLKPCLDSLICQTLQDIEIILVLDLPTDGSDVIAEQYAQRDNRIKIIRNQANLHIGFSRNEGLKIATGEYIGFCDHDDYCEITMYETLYNQAIIDNSEIVVCDFWLKSPTELTHYGFPKKLTNKEFREKSLEALIVGLRSKGNTDSFDNVNNVWNQIFKTDFIIKNNILFDDNRISTYEDSVFNIKTYSVAQSVSYVPQNLYYHITTGINSFNSYGYYSLSKILTHFEIIIQYLDRQRLLDKNIELLSKNILSRLYTSFRNELKFNGLKSIIPFIISARKHEKTQNILSIMSSNKTLLSSFSITKKIFFFLITYGK